MSTKDYFSGHSKLYATFRPTYPEDLYVFIFKHIKNFDTAWDCATGNGQVAQVLAKHFISVEATDISQQQLDNAFQIKNIRYSAQRAEQTTFPNNHFDLITVGQALHWFDLDKFYIEVNRAAKKDGLLAVWGYAVCSVNPQVDEHFNHFYNHVVGPYWDSARKMVEEEYKNVPFPFEQIITPKFSIIVEWTLEEFAGYLTTWSATQKFIKDKNYNPVQEVVKLIQPYWNEKEKVTFPVFLKLGRT
ncbi:MAG TPA: class I SAM-dependent methyltransferase [Cyclobacteriaceae bacterium]|nr:class I SAM-dependent methyltransferase [Cyclobacteriaceae bacterium]